VPPPGAEARNPKGGDLTEKTRTLSKIILPAMRTLRAMRTSQERTILKKLAAQRCRPAGLER